MGMGHPSWSHLLRRSVDDRMQTICITDVENAQFIRREYLTLGEAGMTTLHVGCARRIHQ
jgi:hypothetical protein